MSVEPPGAEQLGSLTLSGELDSAAPARRFVEQILGGRVEDLPALMTSELVTNVAYHSSGRACSPGLVSEGVDREPHDSARVP